MTLFSGRIIVFIMGVVCVFGFALGIIHINSDGVRCFDRKTWRSDRWYTLGAAGKFELRYRNFNYDCLTKYDPTSVKRNDPAAQEYVPN